MRISDWSSDVCSPDLRYLEEHDAFDAEAGVNHERTIVKDEAGTDAEVDLWTTCFTPRELRLLAAAAGLDVSAVWSVTPGAYRADPPSIRSEEHTSELQSLMRISYAVFCWKKKTQCHKQAEKMNNSYSQGQSTLQTRAYDEKLE